mmetsp:Transcript_949/g.1542  ORF Transcript_949/g.1542 Transcript_949/m.1542 type:complete len:576 (+) Transcript_949:567-2294(+)
MHILQPNISEHHGKEIRVILCHRVDASNDKVGRMEGTKQGHEDGEHTHKLSSFALGKTNENEVPNGRKVLLEGLQGEVLNDTFKEIETLMIMLLRPNKPLENSQDSLQILEHIGASFELLDVGLEKTNNSGDVGGSLPQGRVHKLREDGGVGRRDLIGHLQHQSHHLEDIGGVLGNILSQNVLEGGEEKVLEGPNFAGVTSRNVLNDSSNRLEKEVTKHGVLGVLGHFSQNDAQLLDNEFVEGKDIASHLGQDPHDTLHGVFVLIKGVAGLLLAFQHFKRVLEDGGHELFVLVPDTEGFIRVSCGDVFLDSDSCVGVDDVTLRGKHFGEAFKKGRIHFERNDKTESSGKLQRISLQNRVPFRKRFQIREDMSLEVVENGNKRVGGGGSVSRSLAGDRKGRDKVSTDIFFPPVLGGVGGEDLEALGDAVGQDVGHLSLKVLAKTLHKQKGGASPCSRVRPLDITANVLHRVLSEIVLVRLGKKHIGNNDLLADSSHSLFVVEELVVHPRRGDREEANGFRCNAIEPSLLVDLCEKLPDCLSKALHKGFKLLIIFISIQSKTSADLCLKTMEEAWFV